MNLDPKVMMDECNISQKNSKARKHCIGISERCYMCCVGGGPKCRRCQLFFGSKYGKQDDQTEVEILDMLSLHQQTKVIVMYLEDIRDGHKFINICKQITKLTSIKKQCWS